MHAPPPRNFSPSKPVFLKAVSALHSATTQKVLSLDRVEVGHSVQVAVVPLVTLAAGGEGDDWF